MTCIILTLTPVEVASATEAGLLPNPQLTACAGHVTAKCLSGETAKQLCFKSFHTRDERLVEASTKKQVYAEYQMAPHKKPCPCEIDHLISLEIGGSNDISNLWPQPYQTRTWNAHVKDELENHLHKLVCDGTITLQQAQHAIATDWIKAYQKYYSRAQP